MKYDVGNPSNHNSLWFLDACLTDAPSYFSREELNCVSVNHKLQGILGDSFIQQVNLDKSEPMMTCHPSGLWIWADMWSRLTTWCERVLVLVFKQKSKKQSSCPLILWMPLGVRTSRHAWESGKQETTRNLGPQSRHWITALAKPEIILPETSYMKLLAYFIVWTIYMLAITCSQKQSFQIFES